MIFLHLLLSQWMEFLTNDKKIYFPGISTTTPLTTCDPSLGFQMIAGMCLRFVTIPATYCQQREFCQTLGTDLLSYESVDAFESVRTYLLSQYSKYHIKNSLIHFHKMEVLTLLSWILEFFPRTSSNFVILCSLGKLKIQQCISSNNKCWIYKKYKCNFSTIILHLC